MSNHQIQITELSILPVQNRKEGSPLQAFVRIVLNDAFVITGLRVIYGKFGPFVAFPRDQGRKSTICFPIRKDLHEEMSNTVLNEYRLTLSTSQHGIENVVG